MSPVANEHLFDTMAHANLHRVRPDVRAVESTPTMSRVPIARPLRLRRTEAAEVGDV
jgi:hypothetical protein